MDRGDLPRPRICARDVTMSNDASMSILIRPSNAEFEARKTIEVKLMPDIISSTYEGLSCHSFDVELLATEPRTSGRHGNDELGFWQVRTFPRRSIFAPLHSKTV